MEAVPELREALVEHVRDYDEILQHVFFGSVLVPFVVAAWKAGNSELVGRCLEVLEDLTGPSSTLTPCSPASLAITARPTASSTSMRLADGLARRSLTSRSCSGLMPSLGPRPRAAQSRPAVWRRQ
ncbi:hypothetical protein ACIBSW_25070 [Actinoplanes sp. NPDC049668]|uniref:DUF7674 family protein n=1 Tax=unclassified Actinoplanes TaxID=2626549 RepID=UPI00339F3A04